MLAGWLVGWLAGWVVGKEGGRRTRARGRAQGGNGQEDRSEQEKPYIKEIRSPNSRSPEGRYVTSGDNDGTSLRRSKLHVGSEH